MEFNLIHSLLLLSTPVKQPQRDGSTLKLSTWTGVLFCVLWSSNVPLLECSLRVLFLNHQYKGPVSQMHQTCFEDVLQNDDAEGCGEETGKVFFG